MSGYDHWKSTNPDDREYCRCGVHASVCLMNQFGDCPVEDEEEPMAEASPTMNHLIDNARQHLQAVRLRLRDLPAQFDLTKLRVAIDTVEGDLDTMTQYLSKGERA